ncbi:MAG TPA: ABC transporter permease, partial [Thermomicrobiales bacterium]|nr:ABC transporter permease [Thermomicrobiales bacterium]
MGKHLVQRVALAVPLILLVSFMTFAIMRLLPGDPALAALGGQAASPEAVDELRNELGLDKPFYVQYVDFLAGAVQGDFGRSLRTGTRVTEEIRTTLPATAKLAASGLAVAVLIGVPLGVVAALKRNTVVDWFAVLLSTLGISVPTFWLGLA